jgi:hypothetical protein
MPKGFLKGTGFSPYVKEQIKWALAPEGSAKGTAEIAQDAVLG